MPFVVEEITADDRGRKPVHAKVGRLVPRPIRSMTARCRSGATATISARGSAERVQVPGRYPRGIRPLWCREARTAASVE